MVKRNKGILIKTYSIYRPSQTSFDGLVVWGLQITNQNFLKPLHLVCSVVEALDQPVIVCDGTLKGKNSKTLCIFLSNL